MYKLSPLNWGETQSTSVIDLERMCAIPFDPANTDYQTFKYQVLNQEPSGAVVEDGDSFSLNVDPNLSILEDADGVQMTIDQAKAYVATLP